MASGPSARRTGLLGRTGSQTASSELFDGSALTGCLCSIAGSSKRTSANSLIATTNSPLPHSLGQKAPLVVGKKPLRISDPDSAQLRRSDKLGGLVHEYRLLAWAGRIGY